MITFDNVNSAANSSSLSFTNAGSILLAAAYVDDTVSSITTVGYGGNGLTALYALRLGLSQYLWVGYLARPPKGTFDVNFNWDVAPGVWYVAAISFFGVKELAPIGGSNSHTRENDNTSPFQTTVTVQSARGLVVDFFYPIGATAASADSPSVEKVASVGNWGGGTSHVACVSYQTHSGSNTTMSWTFTGSANSDQIHYAVELVPAGLPQINMF